MLASLTPEGKRLGAAKRAGKPFRRVEIAAVRPFGPGAMFASMVGGTSTLARALDANFAALTSPRGFHVFVSVYMLVLLALAGFLFPAASADEAEQLLFSQYLDWGYDLRNPPLYTWLVIAVQQILGVSIFSVVIVKFAAMFLLYIFLYRAARRILEDHRLAALAALSPLAIYYVAYDAVKNYSHTVLLATMCAATFLAVIRLENAKGLRAYVVLGVVLGLGFLSKYTFGIFVVALLAACLLDAPLRARLLDWRTLLSLAVGAAMFAPHFDWFVEHAAAAARLADSHFAMTREDVLGAAALGLWDLGNSYFNFHLPLVPLVFLVFWPAFRERQFFVWPARRAERGSGRQARFRKLLGRFMIAVALILVALVLAMGVTRVRTHYLFILVILPLYSFIWVQWGGAQMERLRTYAGILSMLAAVVVGTLVAKFAIEPLGCRKCTLFVPYAALARDLREMGFEKGKVISWFHPFVISGNLRVHFPDSTFASAKYPQFKPPGLARPGQCLIVWEGRRDPSVKAHLLSLATSRMGAVITGAEPVRSVELPFRGREDRLFRFDYVLVPAGQGSCR